MKLVYLCLISSLLMACQPQPTNQASLQQSYVCKALIEGFLKTQNLNQYELRNVQPDLDMDATQRTYTYRVASDITMRINLPTQPQLAFHCTQQNNQYTVKLMGTDAKSNLNLLSLNIPEKQTIKNLTALQLK